MYYLGTELMILYVFSKVSIFYLNPDVSVCFRLTGQATDLQISDSTKQKQNQKGHMLQFEKKQQVITIYSSIIFNCQHISFPSALQEKQAQAHFCYEVMTCFYYSRNFRRFLLSKLPTTHNESKTTLP